MESGYRNVPSLPCFSPEAPASPGSIWLPLAPACNLECSFCSRRTGAASGSRVPGGFLSPDDAVQRVAGEVERGSGRRSVVIWGPGEPLLAASTYVVLRRLSWYYPDLDLTVCTNGLLLPERLEELVRSGTKRLVVSVNALTTETAERIYRTASYRMRIYEGRDAAALVLQQQWNGLSNAVEAGLAVTVYLAVIPGVNDGEAPDIRAKAEAIGAERVVTKTLDPSAPLYP
jgi:nitrogen fixation protein NifB